MTSPLPPKRRDSRNLEDLLRQDRVRLGQLDRGLAFGKFSPARPLKPRGLGDGDEDDFDDPAILFLNTDTGTVPADGASTPIALSYVPLEGSEQVFYRGMGLKRADWHYTTENRILIPGEPWFRQNDKVWIDYAYEDGEPDTPDPVTSFTMRGVVSANANATVALPTGTAVGDTILLLVMNQRGWNATVSDGRLSLVASLADPSWGSPYSAQIFMGRASDLSNIAITAPSAWPKANVITFAEAMSVAVSGETSIVAATDLAVPTISATAALLLAVQNNDTVTGTSPTVTAAGWTSVADAGPVTNYQEWSLYTYLGDGPTPSGVSVSHGGDAASGKWDVVIGVVAA